jgi:anti-anti-sigma factor
VEASLPAEPEAAAPAAGPTVELCVSAKHRRANVTVLGQLDCHSAADFVGRVDRLVDAGARSVVVDLGACEVGDSAGIAALVTVAARLRGRRGELVLKSPRSPTLRLLESAGVSDTIPIC